jgi:hypothetical protein
MASAGAIVRAVSQHANPARTGFDFGRNFRLTLGVGKTKSLRSFRFYHGQFAWISLLSMQQSIH